MQYILIPIQLETWEFVGPRWRHVRRFNWVFRIYGRSPDMPSWRRNNGTYATDGYFPKRWTRTEYKISETMVKWESNNLMDSRRWMTTQNTVKPVFKTESNGTSQSSSTKNDIYGCLRLSRWPFLHHYYAIFFILHCSFIIKKTHLYLKKVLLCIWLNVSAVTVHKWFIWKSFI